MINNLNIIIPLKNAMNKNNRELAMIVIINFVDINYC